MPELPEVETVRLGLLPALKGQVIKDVLVRRRDLRLPIPDDFEDRTIDQQVERITRRSKYLLLHLGSGDIIIIHLGMSGRIRIETGNPVDPDKHDHVEFITNSRHCIRFGDPRRFGFVDLISPGDGQTYPALSKLGPEPFDTTFDADYLLKKLAGKSVTMKAVLMDQRIVAGLGNIYVNEALFRAGISPRRKAANLSRTKARILIEIIRDVLSEAIEAGGSSLRDHRQTDGELGYFQHSFKVYGREGETCNQCQKSPIQRIVQQGRSTFYCSTCQR